MDNDIFITQAYTILQAVIYGYYRKTYFLIVFHSYHVTYYLYLYCLLFDVVCFEIN